MFSINVLFSTHTTVQPVMFINYIWEVPVSNLGRDTDCSISCDFSLSLPANGGIVSKLLYYSFRPNVSSHYSQSFRYSTLCSLGYRQPRTILYQPMHTLNISNKARSISVLRSGQTHYGPHPAPSWNGTGEFSPRGKTAGAWSWPLTSI